VDISTQPDEDVSQNDSQSQKSSPKSTSRSPIISQLLAESPSPRLARSRTEPSSQPQPHQLRKMKSESESSKPAKSVRFTYTTSPRTRTDEEPPQCALEAFDSRESGKSLQVADDVQFLIDGIGPSNGLNVRSLSVFKLAKMCHQSLDTRMHLRAHSLLPTLVSNLRDAPLHISLGLNTACLLFLLARDSLSPDLEPLVCPLLADLARPSSGCNAKPKTASKQYERMVKEVGALLLEARSAPTALAITPRHLALEACAAILSQQGRATFRCEMRVGGVLQDLVAASVGFLVGHTDVREALAEAELCLRVVQRSIFLDPSNQAFLVHHTDAAFPHALMRLALALAALLAGLPKRAAGEGRAGGRGDEEGEGDSDDEEVAGEGSPPQAAELVESTLAVLRVLLGLTHNNNDACDILVSHAPFIAAVASLCRPERWPVEGGHDGPVLALSLLTNLVEHVDAHRVAVLAACGAGLWAELLALYKQGGDDGTTADDGEETSRGIIAAHAAVLVAFLAAADRARVRAFVACAPADIFTHMAEHLHQFVAYQQSVGVTMVSDFAPAISLLQACAAGPA
jgi:hypothetical protein